LTKITSFFSCSGWVEIRWRKHKLFSYAQSFEPSY